jgi:hypothetical protein
LFAKEGFMLVVQGARGTGEMPMFDFEEVQYNTNALIGNNYEGKENVQMSIVFPYTSYDHILVMLVPEEDTKDVSTN